ncbi:RES family NAD+ phosphorylase, partial [Rhodococcus sp. IEGM 1379]|uniref:RES family NAD+ phosphorylase n=1 Tax=Rhodococcus sp. IEGM 1379 TaxID=3047086 RepID=UPI0024B75994
MITRRRRVESMPAESNTNLRAGMKLSPEPSINGVHQRYGRWVDDTSDLVDRTDAAHRLAWNFCAGFTGAVGLFRTAHWSTLAAGTRVWRVHSTRRSTLAPNPTAQPDELSGDRFDSLDGVFAYLYIADSPGGAIAETICRDLPLDPTVARIVPASAVTGRTLTALRVTRTLTVAALHGPRLSAVGQDLWLTKCEARHYVTTRRWVAAIYAT